jgi:hypothetical protein
MDFNIILRMAMLAALSVLRKTNTWKQAKGERILI